MADALHRVARKSQLILMLSQRVRVGRPDSYNAPFMSLATILETFARVLEFKKSAWLKILHGFPCSDEVRNPFGQDD